MTSREAEGIDPAAVEQFVVAAEQWLREHGQRIAGGLVGALALRRGVTAEDAVAETLLSLVATAQRHGAPVDPSDGDAVAAYTYTTLKHRVYDLCRAAARTGAETLWPDDDTLTMLTTDDDETVTPLLHAWLVDCLRAVLGRRALEPPAAALFAHIALAALTYLQTGAPPDAPQPQTKGSPWTRAGWAALATVDAEHFFPPAQRVAANTATQRRRAALARARALLQDAAAECGAQA